MSSLFYPLGYFAYDKAAGLMSRFLGSIYLPHRNVIVLDIDEAKIKKDSSSDQSVIKMLKTITDNEKEIVYLLNNSFLHGATRYLTLFKQTNIIVAGNKVRLSVSNQEDLINLAKIWFMLKNENQVCDVYIPMINTAVKFDEFVCSYNQLIGVDKLAHSFIEWLLIDDICYVVHNSNSKKVIYKIKRHKLHHILTRHNLIVLQRDLVTNIEDDLWKQYWYRSSDDSKHMMLCCIDDAIVNNYKSDLELVAEAENLPDALNVYVLSLNPENMTACINRLLVCDLERLAGKNFEMAQTDILTGLFEGSRYYLSEFVDLIDNDQRISLDNERLVYDLKPINFHLNIFNGANKHNIVFNSPWITAELGLMLELFGVTQKGQVIFDVQNKIPACDFSYTNQSVRDFLYINRMGWLKSFLVNIDAVDLLLRSNYTQLFIAADHYIVQTQRKVKWFGFVNRTLYMFYRFLFDKCGLDKFLPVGDNIIWHNLMLSASKIKLLSVFKDETSYLDSCRYNVDQWGQVSFLLSQHGINPAISILQVLFDLPGSILKQLFGSKYCSFNFSFDKARFFEFKFGIRNLKYSGIIIGEDMQYGFLPTSQNYCMVVVEPDCVNPSTYWSARYRGDLFNCLCEFDRLISHRSYVYGLNSYSAVSMHVMSIKVTTTPLLQLWLKGWQLQLACNLSVDTLLGNNQTTYIVDASKKMQNSKLTLFTGIYSKSALDAADIKIVGAESELPKFLCQNVSWMATKYHLIKTVKADFMLGLSYIKDFKNSRLELGCYIDSILYDNTADIMFDFMIAYSYVLFSIFNSKICIKFMVNRLRDNFAPISIVIL